jgi:hypothetical protein
MESIQLTFKYTEEEYVSAVRFFLLRSKETLIRLGLTLGGLCLALILLFSLLELELPLFLTISPLVLLGIAIFHALFVRLPRRQFRGNPKFRDEYSLTFSDEGIRFKTRSIDSSVAWDLYTEVVENDRFYLLIYGKNIASFSIVPKRSFRDSMQEAAFREMLGRHLALGAASTNIPGERVGEGEYTPSSFEPPDWR